MLRKVAQIKIWKNATQKGQSDVVHSKLSWPSSPPLHPPAKSFKTFISETRESLWACDGDSEQGRKGPWEGVLVGVMTSHGFLSWIFCFTFETLNKSSPLCCPSAVLEWGREILTLTLVYHALANETEHNFLSLLKPQSSHLQHRLPRPPWLALQGFVEDQMSKWANSWVLSNVLYDGRWTCEALGDAFSLYPVLQGLPEMSSCWQGRWGVLITAYLLSPGTVTASSGDTCRCSSSKVNSRGQPVLNNDAILQAPESSKDAVARDYDKMHVESTNIGIWENSSGLLFGFALYISLKLLFWKEHTHLVKKN